MLRSTLQALDLMSNSTTYSPCGRAQCSKEVHVRCSVDASGWRNALVM